MNVNLDGVRRRSLLAIGGGVAACLAVPSAWSASSGTGA